MATPENLLYRAIVDARFGREEVAIPQFRALLAAGIDQSSQVRVHRELASALIRLGRYGEAASEWREVLRLLPPDDPGRAGVEGALDFYRSLSDVDPPAVDFGAETRIHARRTAFAPRVLSLFGLLPFFEGRTWSIPVVVSGTKSDWIIDSGSSVSLLSESETKRIGLQVRNISVSATGGHTGKQVPGRIAVATDVRIGHAHLHNVVFLVVEDQALRQGLQRIRGILGLPEMRALGCVGISAGGAVRLQDDCARPGDPNLFFDGLTPIVEVEHSDSKVRLAFDTGSQSTYFYSSFRDTLTAEQIRGLTTKQTVFAGLGGRRRMETDIITNVQLDLDDVVVPLKNAVLRREPSSTDGLLGMDVLGLGFVVDFRSMRVSLDNRRDAIE
jgi:hypothetical protein